MEQTPAENPPPRRPVALLRGLGCLELVLLVPAMVVCLMIARQPDALARPMEARLSADQLAWAQQMAPMAAALIALLGVAPAAGYLLLAGAVGRRGRRATAAVQFLLLIQIMEIVVLAIQEFPFVADAVRQGQPMHVTLYVLAVGTPVMLIGYAFLQVGGISTPNKKA